MQLLRILSNNIIKGPNLIILDLKVTDLSYVNTETRSPR